MQEHQIQISNDLFEPKEFTFSSFKNIFTNAQVKINKKKNEQIMFMTSILYNLPTYCGGDFGL